MAIYQCKGCGGKISTRYEGDACPHCGVPIQSDSNSKQQEQIPEVKNKHNMLFIIGIVVLGILLVVGGWIYFSWDGKKSPITQTNMAEEIEVGCDSISLDSASIVPTVDVWEISEEYAPAAQAVDDLSISAYSGDGCGGGLRTELYIRFTSDSECICVSDFYCAFAPSDKRTVK